MLGLFCEILILIVLITLSALKVFGGYLWVVICLLALDAALLARRLVKKRSKSSSADKRVKKESGGEILPPVDQTFFMSGLEFEGYVQSCFDALGYKTERTAVNDQGIDLIVKKLRRGGLQIKCYSKPVSNKAVQEAIAGKAFYKLSYVTVITNSIFTPSAIKLAKKAGVKLIDRAGLASLAAKARNKQR